MNNFELQLRGFPEQTEIPENRKERKKDYNTIIEYAEKEMRGFDALPFSDVDSLILSELCYIHFDGVVPDIAQEGTALTLQSLYRAECMDAFFDHVFSRARCKQLFIACAASPRFRDIRVNYFSDRTDKEVERQFSATTFILPDGTVYVAYRGTDSTVIGWKEDFNLLFQPVIPSQISASVYLGRVANLTDGKIILGGHSKGGTMALYGAATATPQVKSRITAVYNHDGPGLSQQVLDTTAYNDIRHLVHTTLPHNSIIGILFTLDDYEVITSDRHTGFTQHDPFSWQIYNDRFVREDALDKGSLKVNRSVRQLMEELTAEEREVAVDTIFDILESTGVDSFHDFARSVLPNRDKIARAIKRVDPDTYTKVKTVLVETVRILVKNIRSHIE